MKSERYNGAQFRFCIANRIPLPALYYELKNKSIKKFINL